MVKGSLRDDKKIYQKENNIMKKIQIQNSKFKFLKNVSGGFLLWNLSVVCFLIFGIFNTVEAEMRSSSYVIYENVNHTFDGPVVSSVNSSVNRVEATVTWSTDILADSFVIYDTDNSFANSREQGTSVKNFTNHSVTLSGLEERTTYYYRVRSSRVNGGVTTDNTVRQFTTGSVADEGDDNRGGGGVLIIDKTDKIAPVISNIIIDQITSESATISWDTDEESTSFVEYGKTTEYGATYGTWEEVQEHSVNLINLDSSSRYYFRVVSSDGWGNVAYSAEDNFVTLNLQGEEIEEEEILDPEEEEVIEEEENIEDEIGNLGLALENMRGFFTRLFPTVSLNTLEDDMTSIDSLADLSGFIPVPILSGEPRIDIGATEVTISWSTDIEANSLVAMAPSEAYNSEAEEPYLQIVGNSEEQTQEHEVTLYGLSPNTEYHFQLRSKSSIGPLAQSRDFTFRTSMESLEITSFFSNVVDTQTAVFKWVTNKESDSTINFVPYQDNVLAVDESKVVRDNSFSTIHEIEIQEFEAGVIYHIELISTDNNGNTVTEELARFSTSEEDVPPVVSQIKADSTIFVDQSNKIQTVISWVTNEPSTSQVYYKEGVHGGDAILDGETLFNADYTKEHVVVISKFKPGIVYSFRVESIDSGGNISTSKVHTFMTAKKKESIIQIIMNILEDTFGWIKKLM